MKTIIALALLVSLASCSATQYTSYTYQNLKTGEYVTEDQLVKGDSILPVKGEVYVVK